MSDLNNTIHNFKNDKIDLLKHSSDNAEYLLQPCIVGWEIVETPSYFLGKNIQGLIMTGSYEDCIEVLEKSKVKYTVIGDDIE